MINFNKRKRKIELFYSFSTGSTICQCRIKSRRDLVGGGEREILPGSVGARTTHVARSCRATDPFHPKRAIQTLDVR